MHALRRFWRLPIVKVIVVYALVAVAAGVVRGYAGLGRVTIEQHGSVDFGLFYASARQHLEGGTLYGPLVRPGTTDPAEAPNLNPPHANLFFLPFGLLESMPALALWMGLSLLALADMLRIVVRETGARPFSIGGLAALVFLLAWAPMAALVLTAQLGLLVAWPVTRAWRAARHGNWARAGWWMGASAGVKVFLLLLLPYLIVRRHWAALARACVALGLLVIAGSAVFGPGAYVTWMRQFGAVTWQGHYMNASAWGVLARLFEGFRAYEPLVLAPEFVRPIWAGVSLLALAVTWRRLARSPEDADRDMALVMCTALLVSPLGWVYYFWLPLPPVVAWVRRTAFTWTSGSYAVAGLVVAGTLWHASWSIWFQPSALATLTIASPYFWALAGAWWWISVSDYGPSQSRAIRSPANRHCSRGG